MRIIIFLLAAVIALFPVPATAQGPLEEARALLVRNNTLQAYKTAVDLSCLAVQQQPQSFEANWVCAKAHWAYADKAMKREINNWQILCRDYGKKAMGYAEKAVAIDPSRIEGHFWYGCAISAYSDGTGVITAVREGLKGKAQKALENAYTMDKMHENAAPVLALGRFWSVLPWPTRDRSKALRYLEEYHGYFPNDPEGLFYLAQVYLDVKEKEKAKPLLEKAAASNDRYYAGRAEKLLAGM